MNPVICGECGQLWPTTKGKRVCCVCRGTIRKRHRWFFGLNGRPQHYHCDQPEIGAGAAIVKQDVAMTFGSTYIGPGLQLGAGSESGSKPLMSTGDPSESAAVRAAVEGVWI